MVCREHMHPNISSDDTLHTLWCHHNCIVEACDFVTVEDVVLQCGADDVDEIVKLLRKIKVRRKMVNVLKWKTNSSLNLNLILLSVGQSCAMLRQCLYNNSPSFKRMLFVCWSLCFSTCYYFELLKK